MQQPPRIGPCAATATLLSGLLLFFGAACFSDPGVVETESGASSGTTSSRTSSSTQGETSSGAAQSGSSTGGSSSAADFDGTAGCDSLVVIPDREPAVLDVVVVVDTTTPMNDLFLDVTTQLEALSPLIAETADTQLTLVAAVPVDAASGVCVGPPLDAAMSCPGGDDSAPPQYVRALVGNQLGPLGAINEAEPVLAARARPDAALELVIITNGDIALTPGLASTGVDSIGPEYEYARVSAASDGNNMSCSPSPNLAALVDRRKGADTQLCPFDGALFWDEVLRRRPRCGFLLPPPPEGANPIPTVSIEGLPPVEVLGGSSSCETVPGGAYIDPTPPMGPVLRLCPESCWAYQDDDTANAEITFACE